MTIPRKLGIRHFVRIENIDNTTGTFEATVGDFHHTIKQQHTVFIVISRETESLGS